MRNVILIILLFSVLNVDGQNGAKSNATTEIPTVAFCKLIRHPELYDDKIIRVRATWLQTFEWSVLNDINCNGKNKFIEPIWDCPDEKRCKKLQNYLTRNLHGDPIEGTCAEFTFVGRFKDMHDSNPRALGGYPFALYITRIEKAKRIAPNTPSPGENRDKAKPYELPCALNLRPMLPNPTALSVPFINLCWLRAC